MILTCFRVVRFDSSKGVFFFITTSPQLEKIRQLGRHHGLMGIILNYDIRVTNHNCTFIPFSLIITLKFHARHFTNIESEGENAHRFVFREDLTNIVS